MTKNIEFITTIVMLIVTIVLISVVNAFVIPASDGGPVASTGTAGLKVNTDVAARIRPVMTLEDITSVAKAETAAPVIKAVAATAAKSPADLYNGACLACHNTGAAGAPILGDNAAWTPRASMGLDALVTSAKTGKGAMPPNGASSYSESELRSVIEYMLEKAK